MRRDMMPREGGDSQPNWVATPRPGDDGPVTARHRAFAAGPHGIPHGPASVR